MMAAARPAIIKSVSSSVHNQDQALTLMTALLLPSRLKYEPNGKPLNEASSLAGVVVAATVTLGSYTAMYFEAGAGLSIKCQ
jgi:hypothetical protein